LKNNSYVVFNLTRDACLADAAESAHSVLKRMKGLIGYTAGEFVPGKALRIVPSEGIHTFGMRFPIDAAYLDSTGKVLKVYHRLAPYRFAAVMLRARSVLELPPGTLELTGTQVGDILEFQAR
jgi:uncharacterized membrane protein (UPF0127 family)